jgi:MFS superfamily sulfate permease-like transporter
VPLAFACFLLGAVETAAIGRTFVAKYGGRLDNNEDLLALAAANLAAGLGQGLPVSGGMSQSVVNESAGARTPFSGLIAALIILLVAIFLTGLLKNLPQPVLAAVVLVAVAGLFQGDALKRLYRADRQEFITAIVAFVGVLSFGLLRGVLIGALISLVQLLRQTSHPHVAILGRIPGTRRFSDRERHPDNEVSPDVMILRPESGLVYFNIEHVRDAILNAVHAQPVRPAFIVLDLSASPRVDLQSVETLSGMADELHAEGIRVLTVEARSSVRDRIRSVGADTKLGGINRFSTVADVLDNLHGKTVTGEISPNHFVINSSLSP